MQTDKIDAKVMYIEQKYLKRSGKIQESLEKQMQRLIGELKEKYPCLDSRNNLTEADGELKNIAVVQGFLHGGQLPFATERFVLNDIKITYADKARLPLSDAAVMLCVYPKIGVIAVEINLCLTAAKTDTLVYLRHMQGNGEKLDVQFAGEQRKMSISELSQAIFARLSLPLLQAHSAYNLEITKFGTYTAIEEIIAHESKRLYGIMVGDEGWEYMNEELAQERMANAWSSREFAYAIAFGNNFLLLNLLGSPSQQEYLVHQEQFFGQFYGEMNPYFTLQSQIATLNHGLLFAVETCLAVKSFSQSILDKQDNYLAGESKYFHRQIREMKEFRSNLILTISSVENIGISEMGELQQLVLESLKIHPVIDRLKDLLDILEAGLDLLYSTRTNFFVNVLAVLGLILSLIQVLELFI